MYINISYINMYKLNKNLLALLFRLFGFIASTTLNHLLPDLTILSVPDEAYSRSSSCAFNLISTISY